MAWTTPATFSVSQVLTAALMNAISADLTDLDGRTRPQTNAVATSQTTTSTSYTDLATVGPAVTITTGTIAVVSLQCSLTGSNVAAGYYMSVAVSGASTQAAVDLAAVGMQAASGGLQQASAVFLLSGLTAGSNVFTVKFRATAGTLTAGNRILTVWPGNNLT